MQIFSKFLGYAGTVKEMKDPLILMSQKIISWLHATPADGTITFQNRKINSISIGAKLYKVHTTSR